MLVLEKLPPPTPEIMQKCMERFEWLVNFTIVKRRFVHQILGILDKEPNSAVGTMAVTVMSHGRFLLRYNPAWVQELTDEEAAFVFYHEVLHLALHHCTSRPLGKDKQIANYAHDLAVNELIPVEQGCQPPRDKDGSLVGVFVSELKKIPLYSDIEEKQTAEWYYEYLKKKQEENGGKHGFGDGDPSSAQMDDHGGWKEDELADEKVRAKIKEIERMNAWGDMSMHTRESILAAQVKKVNWRNLIRQFTGNILWKTKTTTRKRPNRRTGYTHPGSRRIHVDRVLVAIDTSGSTWCTGTMLPDFLGTINSMVDFFPIDLMQFDAQKTDGPKPYDRRCVNYEFVGCGGTNFQPVMDIAMQGHYKAVIILTDGQAAEPARPPATKVLWVLPKGCRPPVEWGTQIHMERFS